MKKRSKLRIEQSLGPRTRITLFGSMKGTARELGDIVSPVYTDPWDAELGIAYQGEDGPVYYTGNGAETTDDLKRVGHE